MPTALIVSAPSITGSQQITLEGAGTDPEDGDLPDASLQWFSNVDGFLGTGKSLPVTLSNPGCDNSVIHTITLKVIDSDGNEDLDQVVILVAIVC